MRPRCNIRLTKYGMTPSSACCLCDGETHRNLYTENGKTAASEPFPCDGVSCKGWMRVSATGLLWLAFKLRAMKESEAV
mgnify:CR=1 FL=1